MKRRQVLWEIYHHYQIGVTEGSLINLQDLMSVRLNNDNLRAFLNDWESVLAVMATAPTDDVLETLFRTQLSFSSSMKEEIAHYERLDVGHPDKPYTFLVSAVRKHLEMKRRLNAREELQRRSFWKKIWESTTRWRSRKEKEETRPKGGAQRLWKGLQIGQSRTTGRTRQSACNFS